LFAVSVLTRLSWDPRRLLEGAVLGQFVVGQVLHEAKAQAAGGAVIAGLKVRPQEAVPNPSMLAGIPDVESAVQLLLLLLLLLLLPLRQMNHDEVQLQDDF
jgi:hypothetical protein